MPDYVPEPLPTPTVTMSERVDMFKLYLGRDVSSVLQAEVILNQWRYSAREYLGIYPLRRGAM